MKSLLFLSSLLVSLSAHSSSFTLKYSYKCCTQAHCESSYDNLMSPAVTVSFNKNFLHAQYHCLKKGAFYIEGAEKPFTVQKNIVEKIKGLNLSQYYVFMDCPEAKRKREIQLNHIRRMYPNLDYQEVLLSDLIDGGEQDIAHKALVVQSADTYLEKNCK